MKKEKMNPLKTIDLSCNFLLIGIGLLAAFLSFLRELVLIA